MGRYLGLDAHAASCTLAVVDSTGKQLRSTVLETSAPMLISGRARGARASSRPIPNRDRITGRTLCDSWRGGLVVLDHAARL